MCSMIDSNFIEIPRGVQKLLTLNSSRPLDSHRENFFWSSIRETFISMERSYQTEEKSPLRDLSQIAYKKVIKT